MILKKRKKKKSYSYTWCVVLFSQTEEVSSNNAALEAEKSAFKGPKTQELVLFRKLIEKGDMDTVKSTVWSNPRYLITSADTPVILHVREKSFICVGCFVEFRQCCFV